MDGEYFIFNDDSLRLQRCMIVFIVLVLLSVENVQNDHYKYRKRVLSLLYVLFICEITSYILKCNRYVFSQKLIHKFGVELVYIILNCSICYNMNKFLAKSSQTLSLILYGSVGIIITYIVLQHSGYSNIARATLYAINVIVSCYTISILYRLKSYFENLSEMNSSSELHVVIIPVGHIALFRLEWIVLTLNIVMCIICFHYDGIKYTGYRLVNQLRVCLKLLYLIKIYVVMIEGRNISQKKQDDGSNNKSKV
eukprot:427097_1